MPGSRKYADLSKNVRRGGLDDIDTGDSKCHHGSPARKRGRSSDEHSSGWRLFYRSVCSASGSCRRMLKRSRTHVERGALMGVGHTRMRGAPMGGVWDVHP